MSQFDSQNADSFGLASWSFHAATTEHVTAIQMAAMLAGVAGPVVELDYGEVPRPMSPLVPVLVTHGGRRVKALEVFRSTPLDMDARLRKRFAGFAAEDIHRLCLALLDDHVRLLGAARKRAELVRRLELAEKLVVRITAKQPVRRRDLIRTFDNQKLERYRPVIDFLVQEGVLVEEPRNVLRLGACKLETLKARWLADPVLLS